VLEQNPALRLAIGDVTRVGLAENVVEAQPGHLIVHLAPEGMAVPSASYNLQRLYLAYSAATKQPVTVALELRRNGTLYGWFTREGLRHASQDGDRP
jgi:ribosomal protein L9